MSRSVWQEERADLGKGMENQTGKENRIGLEYQVKKDSGLQGMGHGEPGERFCMTRQSRVQGTAHPL